MDTQVPAQTRGSGIFGLAQLLEMIRDHGGEGSRRPLRRFRWRLADSRRNIGRWVGWQDFELLGRETAGNLYHTITLFFDRRGRLAAKAFKGEGGLQMEATFAPDQIIVLSEDEEVADVFRASLAPPRNGSGARTAPKSPVGLLMAMYCRPSNRSYSDYLSGR